MVSGGSADTGIFRRSICRQSTVARGEELPPMTGMVSGFSPDKFRRGQFASYHSLRSGVGVGSTDDAIIKTVAMNAIGGDALRDRRKQVISSLSRAVPTPADQLKDSNCVRRKCCDLFQ